MKKPTREELERERKILRSEMNFYFWICVITLCFAIVGFFSWGYQVHNLEKENLALKEEVLTCGIDFPLTNVIVRCNDSHGPHIWHWKSLDKGTYLYYMKSGICEVLL